MMEVVHRRVEEEEVVVVEQLRTRQRRPDLADPSGDTSRIGDENGASAINVGHKSEEVVDKNGISEESVNFDKNGETKLQWSISDNNLEAKDVDFPKLVNVVINNQKEGNFKEDILSGLSTSTPKSEEENIGKRERVRIDLVEESDEDVIELEFGRAVEKVHTHTPYCPNCDSQITRVVLRRRKRDSHCGNKPVDLFGCLRCFSIFIPSGNCLNPFRLFGYEKKQESIEIVEDKPTSSASLPVSAGGSTNVEGSTYIKQGNVFDLFWIFRKRNENENEKDSQGSDQFKHEGESKDEDENINKQERYPGITPPHPPLPSGDLTIDIGVETDGIKDGVTAPGTAEGEINVEQSDEFQQHPEPDKERRGKTMTDQRGKIDLNDGNQAATSGTLEILKCIVYGGLIESITSLSVVSSAAASGATTLNVIAIGLATVFSGLIVLGDNLMDLKKNISGGNSNLQNDRYQELLGTRGHFLLHATFSIFSYLIFGIIPLITYGLTFRESDNNDYKILAVAAASFACIFILAISKVYARKSEKFIDYIKTIMYYMTMAISVSGVAYAAGDLIKMLMEKLGWFEPNQAANLFVPEMISATPAWASY